MLFMAKTTSQHNLSVVNPKLAQEWHPSKNGKLTPGDVTPRCKRKVWWQCNKGHEWKADVGNRFMGTGCPYCAGKRVTQETSLAAKNAQVVKEWHPTKNGALIPEEVTPGSHKKAWWICSKDKRHEWQAMILHRARKKSGCPFCSGHKASTTDNFKISAPILAKEFDSERNYPLAPEELRPNSARKVWWICPKNKNEHRWLADVASRFKGNGCPYCSGRRVCESNSLQKMRPDLAQQWHPKKNGALAPAAVVAGGHTKVWWLCSFGHEWQATIHSRLNQTSICPKCKPKTSLMELRVYTELKWLFKNVEFRSKKHGVECDVYVPQLKLAIEVDGFYWHRNKLSQDKNKNRILEEQGIKLIRLRENLPRISEIDVIYQYQDKHFFVIKKLLENILKLNVGSSNLESLINEYIGAGNLRNNQEFLQLWNYLPAPLPGTSFQDLHEKKALEWHPTKNGQLKPTDVTPGASRKAVWWICKKGHEWQAGIAQRSSGSGCPYCSGHKVCKDNSLATIKPELVKEWHPTKNGRLTPEHVTPGSSSKKVWWLCEKGHEWETKPLARLYGQGCPFCVGKKASKDNCLATVNPKLAREWHPTKNGSIAPADVTPGSGRMFWWLCEKGHAWDMRILARSHGSNCPYCIGRRVCNDNCLATKNLALANEWHPTKNRALTPNDVTPGSKKKVWWICKNGHEWEAAIKSRNYGNDCPFCARRNGQIKLSAIRFPV